MIVGDKLYCHTVCRMTINKIRATTIGKEYIVIEKFDDELMIINDYNQEHFFEYKNLNKWFWDIRELRKIKLEKIREVRKSLT